MGHDRAVSQSEALDPLSQSLLECLATLEEHLEGEGWDQVPSLWLVRLASSETDSGTKTTTVALELSRLEADHLFARESPIEGLFELAAFTAAHPEPDKDLIAVVFASESWMVTSNTPEEDEEASQVAARRGLSEHPRRVEVRMLSAVDTTGLVLLHFGFRDRSKPPETAVVRPEDREAVAGGDVVDALSQIVTALGPAYQV